MASGGADLPPWLPAPAVLGLVGALLVATDRASASLWLVVVLLVATLVQVRNAYGVLSVLATGAAVGAVAWWVTSCRRARSRRPCRGSCCSARCDRCASCSAADDVGCLLGGESDADALARLTGVPGGMWATLFWLASVAAVIAGAWVLVGGVW